MSVILLSSSCKYVRFISPDTAEISLNSLPWSLSCKTPPVELWRRVAVGQRFLVVGRFIVPAVDLRDPADDSVADGAAGVVGRFSAASLGADLDFASVFACRVHHCLAFPHRHGRWLFDIDVFAGLAGMNRLNSMPVVGGGDDHGVDVLALQQSPVVRVRFHFDTGVGALLHGVGQPDGVDVTGGNDFSSCSIMPS